MRTPTSIHTGFSGLKINQKLTAGKHSVGKSHQKSPILQQCERSELRLFYEIFLIFPQKKFPLFRRENSNIWRLINYTILRVFQGKNITRKSSLKYKLLILDQMILWIMFCTRVTQKMLRRVMMHHKSLAWLHPP